MRAWQQAMIYLARRESIKDIMQSRSSMAQLAERFVGGRDAPAAAATGRALRGQGIASSLFFLGEYVEDRAVIGETVAALKAVMQLLAEAQLDVHISVDPTQIGHQIDARLCRENAFELAEEIRRVTRGVDPPGRSFLMLDMEDSSVTQATLDLHGELTGAGLPTAVTLQAYLYRTEADLAGIVARGGTVRLVKGAFAEDKDIAFTRRSDIDANYLRLADLMLSEEARANGFYPVFGTHDEHMIGPIIEIARRRGWPKERYEFEMLYGVRVDYQRELVRQGERLRLYVPFGTDWWPYAIRRIGESTRNAGFLFRSLLGV